MAQHIKTALALFALLAACAATTEDSLDSELAERDVTTRSIVLSQHQSMARLFGSSDLPSDSNHYLEFVVTDVQNPAKHTAIFNVISISSTGDENIIGSFALFPPDNPGRFIVRLRDQTKMTTDIGLRLESTGLPCTKDAISARVNVSIREHVSVRESTQ